MKRRGVTVLVGCVVLALLVWQIGRVRISYVDLEPGPTYDTLGVADNKPVIAVEGATATKSGGQLKLVTVLVQPELTLWEAMAGWWSRDTAVVPRELIYPPDKSEKQVDADNAKDFAESQSSAETAALRELGYPTEVAVAKISDGLPAAAVLAVNDVITEVDGTKITTPDSLTAAIRAKPAGESHSVTFRRGNVTKTENVATVKSDDGSPRIGIEIAQRQPHPFTLKIQLDKIGGPSAGLMFALGIVDTLKPEDLTGGNVIVGTGTIDDDGKVGAIGGIQQKMVAAKQAKAKVFLTPADNCAEALASAPSGLPLVKVGTLHEALDALSALREHRMPPLCTR
jgi:Lon-like protease